MGLFDSLTSLTKAAVGTVIAGPVAAVADVITMGGALTDQDKPYSAQVAEDVWDNLKDAAKPD